MAYYVVKIIIKDYIFWWCFLIRASGNLGLLSVAKKKKKGVLREILIIIGRNTD